MKINLHNSTKSPKVSSTISVNDWLAKIKLGDRHLPIINKAREYGKGTTIYDDIKKEHLPTVTFNYQFRNYLKLENAVASTGFFYIDIDANSVEESIQIKEKLQQNNHIYATWLSLSEKGVGALVKSSVITPESFKQVLKQFCEEHEIPFDNYATKLTQYNVLSHDPELYLNPEAIEYNPSIAIEKNEKQKSYKKVSSVTNQKKKKHIGTDDTFLRYNNLNDFWIKDDVVTSKEGFDAIELYLPENIKSGKRKHTLLAFANNLVCLNPEATAKQLLGVLKSKNKLRCEVPLEEKELYSIVQAIYRYKEDGTLEPKQMKKRKIIFGPGCGMDKDEKRTFVNQTIGEWKRSKTQEDIYQLIEDWDFQQNGKITAQKVSEISEKSIITIKRYWSEFKDYVNELNQPYKQQKPAKPMKEKKKEINTQLIPINKEQEVIQLNPENVLMELLSQMKYDERIIYLANCCFEQRMVA